MRRRGIFWGAVLLLFGVLLLLSNFNVLPGSACGILFAVLVIALGVRIVVRGTRGGRAGLETAAVPLGGATRGRVTLRHGAGRLSVTDGAAPGLLLDGSFRGGIEHRETRAGDELATDVRVAYDRGWDWMPEGPLDWAVRLADGVPIALILEVGANETHLELSRLLVTDLRLSTGASSTEVTLPAAAGYTRVEVRTGAASVRLAVPQGVAARVTGRAGLATIDVATSRFPRTGDAWESPDYATAPHRVEILAEVGVGSVQVV